MAGLRIAILFCVLLVQMVASQKCNCQSELYISIDDLLNALKEGPTIPGLNENSQISFGGQIISPGNQACNQVSVSQQSCGCNQQPCVPQSCVCNQQPCVQQSRVCYQQPCVQQSCGCNQQPCVQQSYGCNQEPCVQQSCGCNQEPCVQQACGCNQEPCVQQSCGCNQPCGCQQSVSSKPSIAIGQPTFSISSVPCGYQSNQCGCQSNQCGCQQSLTISNPSISFQPISVGQPACVSQPQSKSQGQSYQVISEKVPSYIIPAALLQAPPYGIVFAGDNLLIDGAVQVCGNMPFNSIIELGGVVPTTGAGCVQYSCNDGCSCA